MFPWNCKGTFDKQSWIFAKTYANKAPHEYVVRGGAAGTDEEFMRVVNYIQENGITIHYWNHPNKYIYLDGHHYWVMRDDEDDPTIIAKRIRNEEQLLEKDLNGYTEYKEKVTYRLFPYVG